MRTGEDYLKSLRDRREVYIQGERVADVTTHRAFRNCVASAAHLYDFQSNPKQVEKMTFVSPSTGDRVSRGWQLPATYAELVARREALTAWAETHFGFMGRSPDHVASCISGMVMGAEAFEAYDPRRAAALREYYEFARDRDLFLTYVIINPLADRKKSVHEQTDEALVARICDQDSQGITVKGAKMLGTGAVMANEVLVTSIQPLKPGDEPYAMSFAAPMNAPGLKILSRKSYEASAGSIFDSPLASRYDENDAVLYFDEVKIPWERVFIAGDIAMCQKQFHATPAHIYQNYQCQIRLAVKLRFLAALGRMIAAANGSDNFPQVRETLGELAAHAAFQVGQMSFGDVRGRRKRPTRHALARAQSSHPFADGDQQRVSPGGRTGARQDGRERGRSTGFRHAVSVLAGAAADSCSRNTWRRILPVAVLGRASTKAIWRGYLCGARRDLMNCLSSSARSCVR